jgi:uncharacterized membrane protein YvbJ
MMSLQVQCPACGNDCPYDDPTCPKCGEKWPTADEMMHNMLLKKQRIRLTLALIFVFVAFVLVTFVVYLLNKM